MKFIALCVLAFIFLISACDNDEENIQGVVSFVIPTKTIDTDNLSPVSLNLAIDPASPAASSITLGVSTIGEKGGTAFTSSPPMVEDKIELAVEKGDTNIPLTVTPLEDGIEYDDVRVDFEVSSTGPGLTIDGISGIFTSLYIENNKKQSRALPFIESFDICDEAVGSGGIPAGWEEVVILQNSLNNAHWRCAKGTDGFQINAFSSDGEVGDESEVWLVTPAIDMSEANSPMLGFDVDRRFDTPEFQEYNVMISADYDGSNFETANWEIIEKAVSAIEANDPELDDYENTSPIDISSWGGESVHIAFVYYAESSYSSATILRINNVVIENNDAASY